MKTKSNTNHYQPQPATPRFPHLCLFWACLMLAATGCKPAADVSANPDPVGVYTLASVDGKSVPCELVHEGVTLTIKSGVFTINPDGTCRSQMAFTVPAHGDQSTDMKATCRRQGAELTMKWQGAGRTLGNVHGNLFTMTNEDMVLAYRK